MNRCRKEFFSAQRLCRVGHFAPGFSCDVHGVTDFERFLKFVYAGFLFATGRPNKFSKCSILVFHDAVDQ